MSRTFLSLGLHRPPVAGGSDMEPVADVVIEVADFEHGRTARPGHR